ncbi:MAG: hypothetical protein KF690_01695 [Bacteroidetes bacterium]|nr:hypothetical protein [Bacteroidota bacterium]
MKKSLSWPQYLLLAGISLLAACGKPSGTEVRNTYANGSASETYTLNSDSLRDGPYTSYHPGGKPFEQLVYRNGLLWEVVKIQDSEGKVLAEKTLQDGNGTLPRYSASGQLFARIAYRNGLPDGTMELMEPGTDRQLVSLNYLAGLPVSSDHPLYRARIAKAPVDTSGNEQLPKGEKIAGFSARFPNHILKLLMEQRTDDIYAVAHPLYKQRYKAEDLKNYLTFAQEVLGPYRSYKLESYESQVVPGQGTLIEVTYKTRHLNADGITQLLLVMKDSTDIKLGNVALQTLPGNPVQSLTKLGDPIMKLIQDKKPEQIYAQAGPELRKIPQAQFTAMFNQIYKVGDVSGFMLQHNEFFLIDGMAGVSLLYKMQIGGKDIPLQLIFSRKDGKYQLEGINA